MFGGKVEFIVGKWFRSSSTSLESGSDLIVRDESKGRRRRGREKWRFYTSLKVGRHGMAR